MTYSLSTLRRWALPGLLGGLLACHSTPAENELLRLYLLDDDLALISDNVGKANEGAVKSIEAQVAKNHNQPKDVAVLEQSQAVHAEARQLVAYLRGLRGRLYPATKAPTREQLADRGMVAEVLLNGGRADSLQRRLSRFAGHVHAVMGRAAEPALGVGAADPRVRAVAGEPLAGQSFTDFYFRQATVAEAAAALTQQQARVLRLESDALTKLSRYLACGNVVFDQMGAFASAESNVVAEGETYRAEMFLTASASGIRPKMTVDGQPVPVGRDGKGRVTFTAPPLPPGRSRQTATWLGALTIRTNGRDSTFRVRVPYTIVRRR